MTQCIKLYSESVGCVTLHVILKGPHVCFERQHTCVRQHGGAVEVQTSEQLHVSHTCRVQLQKILHPA